jgi:hypothetical protein
MCIVSLSTPLNYSLLWQWGTQRTQEAHKGYHLRKCFYTFSGAGAVVGMVVSNSSGVICSGN